MDVTAEVIAWGTVLEDDVPAGSRIRVDANGRVEITPPRQVLLEQFRAALTTALAPGGILADGPWAAILAGLDQAGILIIDKEEKRRIWRDLDRALSGEYDDEDRVSLIRSADVHHRLMNLGQR